MKPNHLPRALAIALLPLVLAGCKIEDIPGLGPDPRVLQREADAKAIGSACRHGLRSIEDCYVKNEKASKAAIFDGWKEMDQYMRENKIDGVAPKEELPPQLVEEVMDEKTSDSSAKDKPKPKARLPTEKATS